jgi:uncharacterized protein
MRHRMPWWMAHVFALAVALLCPWGAWAQDVQPVPALSARVIDRTQTLSDAQRSALESKLAAFEAQAGPQMVVLIINSALPEDISSYAQRVADTWKIGRRNVGDGVLVVVAKGDRQVRIEVAKALEGAIPDLAARQIIDKAVKPAFRANDYAGGLNAALDQLMGRIKGEGLPAPSARGGGADMGVLGGMPIEGIAIFFFVAVTMVGGVLSRIVGRRLGSMLTAGAAGGLAWVISTSVLIAVGAGVIALLLVGPRCAAPGWAVGVVMAAALAVMAALAAVVVGLAAAGVVFLPVVVVTLAAAVPPATGRGADHGTPEPNPETPLVGRNRRHARA